ncbi:MAG: tRNA (adenosine(37)-N6)-threonylcarbamoyltransferase complex ATPase subunit type 1 TsaE [Flavobacteriales bacterium]
MKIKSTQLSDLPNVAKEILALSKSNIITFEGEIGVGKTTLITQICLALGIEEKVTSPSYSIVNEYVNGETPVYHFDFYRLNEEEEAFDIGVEDYFYSGNMCLIEWPEKIPNILPAQATTVKISQNEDSRFYEVHHS